MSANKLYKIIFIISKIAIQIMFYVPLFLIHGGKNKIIFALFYVSVMSFTFLYKNMQYKLNKLGTD